MMGGDPKKQAKIVNVCGCLRGEWVGKNLHVWMFTNTNNVIHK